MAGGDAVDYRLATTAHDQRRGVGRLPDHGDARNQPELHGEQTDALLTVNKAVATVVGQREEQDSTARPTRR